jgi:hypothetical protein
MTNWTRVIVIAGLVSFLVVCAMLLVIRSGTVPYHNSVCDSK